MAEFLSDAWIESLDDAARSVVVASDLQLVIQQLIVDETGTEQRAFAVRIAAGRVEVLAGRAPDADVSFTQDRATAAAIAQGETSAQAAFMAGHLRVGGDLRIVLDRAQELAAMADVFARTRAATSY